VNGTIFVVVVHNLCLLPVQVMLSALVLAQTIAGGGTVHFQPPTSAKALTLLSAANGLDPKTTPAVTLVIDLRGLTLTGIVISVPPQVMIKLIGGLLSGSPPLTVESGQVVVHGATFSDSSGLPPTEVRGGTLQLQYVIDEQVSLRWFIAR
jgi:hypothetical protein